MRMIQVVAALVVCVIVSGCSSAPVLNEHHSFAWNVAMASGGLKSLRDTKIPKEQQGKFIDSGVADIAWLSASYTNPLGGFSGGASLGLNAAAWLFSPTDPAKESRVLAWLPKNLVGAADAKQVLGDALSNAYMATAKEFQFEAIKVGSGAEGFVAMSTNAVTRKIVVNLSAPDEVITPAFIGEGASYLFTTNSYHEKQSVFKMSKFDGISESKFLMAYSKNLPSWIFLYIAPSKLKDDTGNEIKIPMMLNQGKAHFFVVPQ